MSAKRNKSTVYTLSLVSDGGRSRSVKLLQGRPVMFLLVIGAVTALLAGLTGLISFGSPLRDMIPGWSLPVSQKKLVALQAARVDSLIIEIAKMSAFSQKVEGVMFQEKELATEQIGGRVRAEHFLCQPVTLARFTRNRQSVWIYRAVGDRFRITAIQAGR